MRLLLNSSAELKKRVCVTAKNQNKKQLTGKRISRKSEGYQMIRPNIPKQNIEQIKNFHIQQFQSALLPSKSVTLDHLYCTTLAAVAARGSCSFDDLGHFFPPVACFNIK